MIRSVFLLVATAFAVNDAAVEVKFNLYTSETGAGSPKVLALNNYGDAQLDVSKSYKVLCHGWIANGTTAWYTRAIEEYLKSPGVNVIAVDYEKAVSSILYVSAVMNVKKVGSKIGKFLVDMNTNKNIPFENMHVIGHSIGAHVAGIAGETVSEDSGGKKIGRVTGLDPASILFFPGAKSKQISEDDASFVDIIHTSRIMAFTMPLGMADFYPNGGSKHPGCKPLDNDCSHNIAPIFFYESINNDQFMSTKCDSYQSYKQDMCASGAQSPMGEHADRSATGTYYVKTGPGIGENFYG